MRPTTVPTTTIVTSCEAATVRTETVLPVVRLSNTVGRQRIVACSLVVVAFGVCDKDADAVFCISCKVPHLQVSALIILISDHPHLKAAGCQR